MKKRNFLIPLLLILCLCSACGSTESNSGADVDNTASVQTSIPESAVEILPGLGIELDLEGEVPELSLYDYSDTEESAVYTYIYLLNELIGIEGFDDCKIVFYTEDDNIETSFKEQISAQAEDIKMPASWMAFMEEKEIGNGSVTIGDFLNQEDISTIEEQVQKNVLSVLSEYYSEKATQSSGDSADAAQETEANEQNVLKAETYSVDGNEISITLFESAGKYYLWAADTATNEEQASLFFAYFLDVFTKMENADIDYYCIAVLCNEKSATYISDGNTTQLYGTNTDGTTVSNVPDWIITNVEDFTMTNSEMEDFLLELQNAVNDYTTKLEQ